MACNQSIKINYYSPGHSAIETQLGITNGVNGLLQGVLPNTARDSLLPNNVGNVLTTTYLVRIGVYDPNIFPSVTTGRCTQVVASNRSNPLNNCLNNTAALARALNTTDSAVTAANQNNIIYKTKSQVPYQATLTLYNVTQTRSILNGTYLTAANSYTTKNVNASNTNVVKLILLASTQPATTVATTIPTTVPTTVPTTAPTTVASTAPVTMFSGSAVMYSTIIVVVLIIVVVVAYAAMKGKKPAKEEKKPAKGKK